MRLRLDYAEVMASYSCNLSCVGCTNYSNYDYRGFADWGEVRDSLLAWIPLIEFASFGIIGGEPLLNPGLRQWVYGIREIIPPSSVLVLVTNGTRLHRRPEVVEWMVDCAPSKLSIAAHHSREEIYATADDILRGHERRFRRETVVEPDAAGNPLPLLHYTLDDPRVLVEVFQPQVFVKSYRGFGREIRPWEHGDPVGAIEVCSTRYCPLLYEGRLYKCSQIALLRDHLSRLGIVDVPEWQPYLTYRGVAPTDEPKKIERFVRLFGQAERICRMCPSGHDEDAWIDHPSTVTTKAQFRREHGAGWSL
jgi:organic radical activating enzyme